MKKILLLFLLLLCFGARAQEFDAQRAKRLFERTFYSDALPLYEELVKDNRSLEVLRNLSDCYYYTNDIGNALQYYRLLLSTFPNVDDEYRFRYNQCLRATGNTELANGLLRKSLNGAALDAFEKSVHELDNISGIGNRFEIHNLAVNTKDADFGAIMAGDSIVFAATANDPVSKRYKWNDERYLDLFSIASAEATTARPFPAAVNTMMHEAGAVITKDGNTMYFTRNNYKNGKRAKNAQKVSVMQLFRAERVAGQWANITALPFNSEDYSVEHPALADDGRTLYFASDMPGTLGSFDIFSVSINGNDYGALVNLGDRINTPRKEQFPFVSKDDKLYFSSNGHFGYGLMDVFVSEIHDGSFSRPLNVGLPVNSGYDDFAFNIDPVTKEGFFASDRPGGKGGDDMYSLLETKPLIVRDCMQWIAGIISDVDTALPLENAIVVLQDENRKEILRTTTQPDGKFSFEALCGSGYVVLASKTMYSSDSRKLSLDKTRDKVNDASMALKSDAAVKKEQQVAADKEKAELAEKQEQQREQDKQLAETRKKEKEEAIISKEKDVVRDNGRLLIRTEPIYFDYDLWYIRKESKPILNRVIELMKKYPDMVVEIGSHTDVRGNNAYNLELSSKRAESTRDYFLKMGVPAGRISAKGYGETVPIIPCIPDHSCTEEQHELNRRSEFVIKNL
ncbi:flagellar motor protein MotB [Flavobacterium magnum]|uniref:Flagellar motor protein MotB n=1 Tax=Flavobacterium magnum TaxID=2162713 RepID=A0A2S0RDB1_9FLAO|nr:OmpA family protein [Flavobacterium magnum]AWA29605.1 flagellar motor protein MotB [Flavobacterium magnum]